MGRIVGILAIKNYLGVSESTVMDMIHNQGMPATKDEKLNVWEIDQARLDRWRADPERDAKMAAVAEKSVSGDEVDAEFEPEGEVEPEGEAEVDAEFKPETTADARFTEEKQKSTKRGRGKKK
jgi:hypothetical protein